MKPMVHAGFFLFSGRAFIDLVKVIVFGAWIWMIVKVAQNETFKLPFLGELAERSVSEQR